LTVYSTATTRVGAVIQGAASQTANLQEWQNSAGTPLVRIQSTGVVKVGTPITGVVGINNEVADAIVLSVRGISGQTANLQEWQNSAGTVLARIASDGAMYNGAFVTTNSLAVLNENNSGGSIRFTKATSAQTNPGANIGRLYFRDGTNAGTLKLVVRAGAAGAETTILDNIPQ
jgi:hypothetical protein